MRNAENQKPNTKHKTPYDFKSEIRNLKSNIVEPEPIELS